MAEEYASFVITNAGKDIIARIIAGLKVTFSKIAIGDGFDYNADEFITKTELVNKVMSLNITNIQINDAETVELTAAFGSSDVEREFWYREVGVYVVDPDNETKEILFAYGNRNNAAEYITPHMQNYAILKNIKCVIPVGESANVKIYINLNNALNTFDFTVDDWAYSETSGTYVINTGQMGAGVNIYKKSELGRITVDGVDIVINSNKVISLHSLEPFEGYLIFA